MAVKDVLLYTLGTAFLIGFIYMIVLRLCGGPIIYVSILAMIGGTGYGGYLLYENAMALPETSKYYPYYLYGSYAVWGLTFILFCCACCNQKNIRIGVAVMKCTAKFIGSTPQVFLAPPIACITVLAWFGIWAVGTAYIVSVGQIGPSKTIRFMTAVKWNEET